MFIDMVNNSTHKKDLRESVLFGQEEEPGIQSSYTCQEFYEREEGRKRLADDLTTRLDVLRRAVSSRSFPCFQ